MWSHWKDTNRRPRLEGKEGLLGEPGQKSTGRGNQFTGRFEAGEQVRIGF